MNTPLPEEFRTFCEDLAALPSFWRSVDVRVVAVRIGGAWHNIGTRAYLDPRSPDDVTRFPHLPSSERLVALQEVMDIEKLEPLLMQVSAQEATFAGERVRFEKAGGGVGDSAQAYSFGVGFSDVSSGLGRDYLYWSTLSAWGHGSALANLVGPGGITRDRIEAATRLGDAPYDGLGDLQRFFLGGPQAADGSTSVAFEVFAPIQVRVDRQRSRLARGKLEIRLSALSEEFLEACSVGVFGIDMTDLPVQKSLTPRDAIRDEATGTWHSEVAVDVGDTIYAKLMLRVGPWCVDRAVLPDLHRPGRNQRQRAYQVLDPDEVVLQEGLFPTSQDRDDQFERAVARLFVFLGYQVDSFAGDKRLGDGVDLMAHEPFRPVVLAAECTTGPPGTRGKLGRLVARARTLSRRLEDVTVVPVLVTSLPRASIPKDQQGAASDDGVALVSSDDIGELLRAAGQSLPVDSVTSLIQGMIPPGRTAVWA